MARFKTKPQFVEAKQFFYDAPVMHGVTYPELSADGRTWIGDAYVTDRSWFRHELSNGDWVIDLGDGYYTKLDNDTFLETYEAA